MTRREAILAVATAPLTVRFGTWRASPFEVAYGEVTASSVEGDQGYFAIGQDVSINFRPGSVGAMIFEHNLKDKLIRLTATVVDKEERQ